MCVSGGGGDKVYSSPTKYIGWQPHLPCPFALPTPMCIMFISVIMPFSLTSNPYDPYECIMMLQY